MKPTDLPKELLTDFVSYLKKKNVPTNEIVDILKIRTFQSNLGWFIGWLNTKNIVIHADNDCYCFTFADFTKCTKEQQSYYVGRDIFYIKHKNSKDSIINNYSKCIKEVISYLINPF